MCNIYFWKLCFLLNLCATESSTNCIYRFIAFRAYTTLNKENIWFLCISNAMYAFKIFQDKLVNEVCWLINNILLHFLCFFFPFKTLWLMLSSYQSGVTSHALGISCCCQLYKVTGILSSIFCPQNNTSKIRQTNR